jgi:hypothetical protein
MTAPDEPTDDNKDDEDPKEEGAEVRYPTGPRETPQAE